MIRRRELFGVAAASLAAAKAMSGDVAQAAEAVAKSKSPAQAADAMQKLAGITPRGFEGRLKRLPSLDLESLQDFTLGFRLLHGKQIRAASIAAFERVLEAEGIDPTTPLSAEEVRALAVKDPAINIANKTWLQNQTVTWKTLQDHFHGHYDYYMSELEAGDKAGPGKLVMSPQMEIPEYTRHEIHIQPGGYVADPFGGYVYHYGTNSFYISVMGHNEQDQVHKGVVSRLPLPPDGKVRRILDMGCGIGQYTVALKERFPDAEVWGVEIGGPMVRYAHMRASRLGNGANFAQKLAEDTGFPDGYFDIVTSYIMHHEVPAQKTLEIIEEAKRVTRPGGVYYPIDFNTGGLKSPGRAMYSRWMDHRWNNEVWSLEYHSVPFSEEIGKRGFTAAKNPAVALPGFGVRHFIRNA
jgi:ubiquinone/menaquinone biosynthesis C-methylase UbiE